MNLPDNPTKSFQARNPHLYPGTVPLKTDTTNAAPGKLQRLAADIIKLHTPDAAPGIRIRQDSKPLMNKLEQEWFNRIRSTDRFKSVRAQSKRFKLGNGIWYKPDATAIDTMTGTETAWEVKGPHAFRGGFENLKVAAGMYSEIEWILVWKESGEWKVQRVLQ